MRWKHVLIMTHSSAQYFQYNFSISITLLCNLCKKWFYPLIYPLINFLWEHNILNNVLQVRGNSGIGHSKLLWYWIHFVVDILLNICKSNSSKNSWISGVVGSLWISFRIQVQFLINVWFRLANSSSMIFFISLRILKFC